MIDKIFDQTKARKYFRNIRVVNTRDDPFALCLQSDGGRFKICKFRSFSSPPMFVFSSSSFPVSFLYPFILYPSGRLGHCETTQLQGCGCRYTSKTNTLYLYIVSFGLNTQYNGTGTLFGLFEQRRGRMDLPQSTAIMYF